MRVHKMYITPIQSVCEGTAQGCEYPETRVLGTVLEAAYQKVS